MSSATAAAAPTAVSSPAGTTLYQLFDGKGENEGGSSTFSYLLVCDSTKECLLIDPVLEQVGRDTTMIESLGLSLRYVLNTHCHADHITGSGKLKERFTDAQSCISAASGAKADVQLTDNQIIEWGKDHSLQVLATPGHTAGCISFHDATLSSVFTGDALMIGGCGRTDFQEGDSNVLYESVHTRLFNGLAPETTVYPGHDYKGNTSSTVGAEKETNPRLSKSKEEFIDIMKNLNLSYPGKLEVAVPANMQCGV